MTKGEEEQGKVQVDCGVSSPSQTVFHHIGHENF